MAAGDFYIRRNASETDIIGDLGTLYAGWDTLVKDEGSIVTYTDPNLQLDIGLYLIMYSEYFISDSTTNNERVEIQGEIHAGGSAVGGYSIDYIRKSSGIGQDCTVSGSMILDVTADNTNISTYFYRSDTSQDATGVHRVGGHGGITILQLDTADDYAFYSNSAAQTLSGNSAVDVVLNTNDLQETGFSRTGNDVTITTAGRYLVTYTNKLLQSGTGREDYTMYLVANDTKIPGSSSYTYSRGDSDENCDNGVCTWIGIVDLAASDVITLIGISPSTSFPGSILAGTCSLQFWQLPTGAETAIIEATTGDFNANAIFDWDTQPHIDTGSFTYTNGNSNVDVDQDDHVLVFATMFNELADTPQRSIPRVTFLKDGLEQTHASASVYHRNSASDGVSVNAATIIPNIESGMGLEAQTFPLEATGSMTNDSGQFSMLSLESIYNYTYVFPPTVSDVDTDEAVGNTQTNVIITGTHFEAVKGTGLVELVENFDYTGTKVTQSTDTWADTSIQFDVTASTLADTNCYLFVTNDTGSRASIAVQVGLPPETYQEAVEGMTLSPSHYWTFQNTYNDEVGSATCVVNGGTPTFDTGVLLCKGDTHSLLLASVDDHINPPNQSDMNDGSQSRRYVGGWIQLDGISQSLSVIWEEGAQVNNIALLNGFGNNAMFQIANASDDYIQTYFDKSLAVDRPYHVLLEFNASGYKSGVCSLFLDGVKQVKSNGNPWETGQLDSHTGSITWGHDTGESLKVGDDRGVDATTIAFTSPVSCNYAHWYSWTGVTFSDDVADIRVTLFEKGAPATYTITGGTEAAMQTALDVYNETLHTDAPCVFEIGDCTAGDFDLDFNDITFEDRCSIHVRYIGNNTLTITCINGSLLDTDKISTPSGGTVTLVYPITLTLDGLIDGGEVRIYDDEVGGNYFGTELSGVETLSGTTYYYNHPGVANDILVQMMAFGYLETLIPYSLSAVNQTIDIVAVLDINAADAKLILKGYIMGGYDTVSVAVIEDLIFSTETSQVITATLDTAKLSGAGVNSSAKGYCMGGYTSSETAVIEDLIFLGETSQVITATLDTAKTYVTGVSSSPKGYIMGGWSNTAVIEDLIFSNETSQAISATLDTAKYNGTGVNSSLKGYIMGGDPITAVIEDLIFSTETSQALTATLDTAKYWGTGVSSSFKGYILGGDTGSATAVIEDLIFSTETSQAISATLDTAKSFGVGVNSSTKGYIMGGYVSGSTAVIEDLIFSNETSQAITATLDTAKRLGAGVQSGWNPTPLQAIPKGYMMGGYTGAYTAVIEDLIFSTETSQAIAATLDTAKTYATGVNSSAKGYIMGGNTGSYIAVIEDLIFLGETSQVITATLDTAKSYGAGVNSSTKGYCMGGDVGGSTAVIEDLIFSNETSQAITATLDSAKSNGTGVSSSLKGYIMGGAEGFSEIAVIEDLIFSNETSQAITATLDSAKYQGAGVSSSTKGYMMGGTAGPNTAVIEDLTFATETSQAITATLDTAKSYGTGVSSSAKGYCMGGYTSSYTTAIEDLTFSNETTQIITATLDTAKYAGAGVQSGWNPTPLQAIPKGYIMGGNTATAVIEDLIFSTETSQVITATLDTAKHSGAGVNSSAKGYMMGGYTSSYTVVIEDLIFLGETSQAISATLDTAKSYGAGVSSSAKGYIMGGNTGSNTAVIEDLIFSTETSQAITATLDTAKSYGTGVSSSAKGYCMGGYTSSETAVIEDLIFSTETSQAITATLDTAKSNGAGVSSSTKGYMMGGAEGLSGIAVIEDLTFATETSQAITATLDTARYAGAGVNSSAKGYMMGGTTGPTNTAVIEDLVFSNETSQVITATLDTAKFYGAGVQSGQ